MSIPSSLNCYSLREYPLVQAGSIAFISYLGITTSRHFHWEVNPYLHYLGKMISAVAVMVILHFSGLLSEQCFIDRISLRVFTLGPLDCSTSLEDLQKWFYKLFKLS